jgi:hypothetical protein
VSRTPPPSTGRVHGRSASASGAHPAAPSGTAATLRQLRHDECTLHHNCDIGSLEEIVPGRTYLTLAPGFISTRSMGMGRAPVAFMRDAILDLRRLLAGEAVEFG